MQHLTTILADVEDKLMGPLFASHKTGAVLLKEAAVSQGAPARSSQVDDNDDYDVDDTSEPSSLQMSPLVEDPSSLINQYLNCSEEDSHTTPKSTNPNKLTISVSPIGDPLEGVISFAFIDVSLVASRLMQSSNMAGPLRSPQEIVAAMSASKVKSVMKKTATRHSAQKRSNIEFNEALSEV